MRTFFLFYVLSYLLRNPLLALLIVGAVVYLTEARYSGRYFNPANYYTRHHAVRELRRVLDVNDHDVGAHNDLGRLLVEDGKFADARPHLEKAIRRMNESPETNFFYGLCLLETGDRAGGESYVRKALEIKPRFLYGRPQIALARHLLEQGRAEEALESAKQAVALNTSSVEGWVLVARAHLALERRDEAGEAYRSALDAFDHLPHYLRLANRKWRSEAKKGGKSLDA